MTERDDFIADLVTETAELNSATYEHLRSYATIGLPLEHIPLTFTRTPHA